MIRTEGMTQAAMDNDTMVALEERLRRNSGWRNERHQCVTDPNLLTEAADEIASLRARVEAANELAEAGLRVLSAMDDYNEKHGTFIGGAPFFELARRIAALKDTPDE